MKIKILRTVLGAALLLTLGTTALAGAGNRKNAPGKLVCAGVIAAMPYELTPEKEPAEEEPAEEEEALTPLPEQNRWGISLTEQETELLAGIVWVEARGEIRAGKEAVVECVFNRMKSDRFPDALVDVLREKGQFSSWKLIETAEPGQDEYEAVNEVLSGHTDWIGWNYVFFSTGKDNGKDFIKIGNHWFGGL